jgi:hypothetical protein
MTRTPRSVAIYVVLLVVCLASVALADDFKTIQGKEYKNAKVSRIEPDGIVLITKSGISKVYFTELPKDVQERFHYDSAKAIAYSNEQSAIQEEVRKKRDEIQRRLTEERNKIGADREWKTAQSSTRSLQIPFLTAISLDTGSFITQGGSGVRSIGNVTYINKSQITTHILAVKVQLRTPGNALVEPYEVQCFFIAKDKSQARYIYDAIKFHSSTQFDEVNVAARDLFGGTKTVDISVSKNPIAGVTSQGDHFYGTLTDTVVLTSTKPGSHVEGWIVRVLSQGQVVRLQASLSELKPFAEWQGSLLDKAANSVSFKD